MANVPWGNTLEKDKPEGVFHMYGMNLNGFRLNKKGGDVTEFFVMASSISANFIGCSEHNLDFTQFRVQDTAYQAIHNTVEHSKVVWSDTPITFNNMYKPGGTMSCVISNGVARVKETGSDDMGRWTYIKLAAKDNHVITVITVYQVCNKPLTAITLDKCTAQAQQRSLLIQGNKKDPNIFSKT
jgi:hypothetical protein